METNKVDSTEDLDPPSVETKEMQFYDSEAAKECIEALYQIDIMCEIVFFGRNDWRSKKSSRISL